MAKTKKPKKKTTHRRHSSVGALSPQKMNMLQILVGAAIGGAGGWYIYTTQKSLTDQLMGALQAGLAIAGILLTDIPFVNGVAAGLGASAAIIEGESFGILSGVTNLPQTNNLKIAGTGAGVPQVGNVIPGGRFPQPGAVGNAMNRKYGGMYGQ